MSSPSPSLQSSSEESLPSANKLFEEQASYILARNTLPYEDLLKSFQSRYRLQNSGALSDAIIKSAKRIINRQPNTDTKEWAETLIINTKGSKKQKLNSGQAIPAHDDYIHYEEMLNEGAHTPPHKVTVDSEIPKVSDMAAMFHHVDATGNNDGTEHLSETNLKLLESATFWYKKLTAKGIDQAIMSMREDRYPIAWIHDLIYDRVDGFYSGKDGMIDIIVENVGAPSSSNYAKKLEDERKCWRNTADALLERYYLSTGSFEVAKKYNVISMVIYGLEVSLYVTSIVGANSYQTVLEGNQDVAQRFDETIDSLPRHEQAYFNLKLHLTPTKKSKDI
ncbi:hypothetical protein BGX20_004401 [Mortierella sp. AD010]|nr:hypothetical protein BGX20_004401 [Mortierella sp. AD010]